LALTLALGTPTSSDYEATAIYHAAMFHEKVKPGCLTRLAALPRVTSTRIADGEPFPLAWRVVFTDRKTGRAFSGRTFIGQSTVNDFKNLQYDPAAAHSWLPLAPDPPEPR
jgi:hypothetical protein